MEIFFFFCFPISPQEDCKSPEGRVPYSAFKPSYQCIVHCRCSVNMSFPCRDMECQCPALAGMNMWSHGWGGFSGAIISWLSRVIYSVSFQVISWQLTTDQHKSCNPGMPQEPWIKTTAVQPTLTQEKGADIYSKPFSWFKTQCHSMNPT